MGYQESIMAPGEATWWCRSSVEAGQETLQTQCKRREGALESTVHYRSPSLRTLGGCWPGIVMASGNVNGILQFQFHVHVGRWHSDRVGG